MEPLFFKAENRGIGGVLVATQKLQWSRFFSKRKTMKKQSTGEAVPGLQWSRFFSKRKTPTALLFTQQFAQGLQWSRFFSKRKTQIEMKPEAKLTYASMEPLFFKAENTWRLGGSQGNGSASMEPLFFKAENSRRLPKAESYWDASMEPLFFKAENPALPCDADRKEPLQWSRFFSKRKTPYRKGVAQS